MKRANSDLIAAFLLNVQNGLIAGKAETSGPVALEKIVAALEAIADGVDPDVALELSRRSGGPSDNTNAALATLIHKHRKAGEKWATIELLAEQWLHDAGRESVTLTRMKQVYRAHLRALQRSDDIDRMKALTEESQQRRDR